MTLHIYNTLTGKKERFEPHEPGHVRMYTCGPTVYDRIHLGNARAFVVPDVMKRYMQWSGYEVTHVQNITDIEDKIIAKAMAEQVDYQEIVDRYANAYLDDLQQLQCQLPNENPKASEHIDGMIDMITTLIDKGHAYAVGANVYFSVPSLPTYGALSGQSLDEMQAGARVQVDDEKRHPADFALWKAAKPGEPYWDSPWGPGRPGWHIECSVMSSTYLGQPIDIHTGGADLIFPHHENEIAQSEAATGKQFVRYWVHNGYINVDGEKMAKSKGNFFTLATILEQYPSPVVRLFLVSKHYRSPIEFNEEVMAATERGFKRLHDAAQALRRLVPAQYVTDAPGAPQTDAAQQLVAATQQAIAQFKKGMDDDFNTAIALAALYDLTRHTNGLHRVLAGDPAADVLRAAGYALHTLDELAGVLGLDLSAPWHADSGGNSVIVDGLMDLIISLRQEARAQRSWELADRIRDGVQALGITLEDGPEGTVWKYANSTDGGAHE